MTFTCGHERAGRNRLVTTDVRVRPSGERHRFRRVRCRECLNAAARRWARVHKGPTLRRFLAQREARELARIDARAAGPRCACGLRGEHAHDTIADRALRRVA